MSNSKKGLYAVGGAVAGAALGYLYDRREKEFTFAGALVGGLVGFLHARKVGA